MDAKLEFFFSIRRYRNCFGPNPDGWFRCLYAGFSTRTYHVFVERGRPTDRAATAPAWRFEARRWPHLHPADRYDRRNAGSTV